MREDCGTGDEYIALARIDVCKKAGPLRKVLRVVFQLTSNRVLNYLLVEDQVTITCLHVECRRASWVTHWIDAREVIVWLVHG